MIGQVHIAQEGMRHNAAKVLVVTCAYYGIVMHACMHALLM